MDFLEHDLKTLLEDMREPFLPSEIKTLLLQIISATEFLHSHWILHRDLKTSNLLMNNRGEIKVADFGMARYYGDPPPKLTQLVVTLWYRSPELLLGADKYGPEIDIWSIGCIFGELLTIEPLFQGKNEVDQLSKVSTLAAVFSSDAVADRNTYRYSPSLALPPNRHGHPSAPCPTQSPFAYHQDHHRLPLLRPHSSPDRNFHTSPTPASPCSPLSWH
jgi:cell division cycle 2-like protein